TRTFVDLPFRHHRPEGHRDGRFAARVQQGRAAHYMGYRAWYLALRSLRNLPRDPGAAGLIWGYTGSAFRREEKCPDLAARKYLRRQQRVGRLPARMRETFARRGHLPA